MIYHWTKTDLAGAIQYAIKAGGIVESDEPHPQEGPGYDTSVKLANGAWIGSKSHWCGPYSEVTPDVDSEPPIFYIGEPVKDKCPCCNQSVP